MPILKSRDWSKSTAAAAWSMASISRSIRAKSSGCWAQRRRQNHQLPHGLRNDRSRCRPRDAQRNRRDQWPMYRRARDGGMGYLAQEQSVFRKLSVEKNLLAVMEMLGMGAAERRKRCEELLEQFDIGRIRKSDRDARSPAAKSGGWKSPARWSPIPRSSCSTSRSPASTR